MRVQGGLEDDGDIAVLGLDVVHELVVDVELAAGDVLQAGDHTQRGRLAAAGGTNEHDELAVGDLEVEVLDGDDALVGDLEVMLVALLLARPARWIDLLDVAQRNAGHDGSFLFPLLGQFPSVNRCEQGFLARPGTT